MLYGHRGYAGKSGARVVLLALLLLPACRDSEQPTAPSEAPALAVQPATGYRAINLGVLAQGRSSVANAVSPAGHVVGSSWTSFNQPNEHAFLWYNGVMTDLGTLGGCCSTAYSVNRAGKVVGMSTTSTGAQHGFIWKDGVMTDMTTLGRQVSEATDVNTVGQVIGTGNDGAFIFYREVFTNLVRIQPKAISAIGWVAGEGQTASGAQRAFLWRDGGRTNLGTLGGDFSSALDLNRIGAVVGISRNRDGRYRAFLWQAGAMRDLRVPGVLSSANGINEAGVVVGQRQTSSDFRAFVLRAGVVQDLPSLGGKYGSAEDINPTGWIVGQSRTADQQNGGPFATLWVPKQ
jgi:probable HAF family extracellular repeat protein